MSALPVLPSALVRFVGGFLPAKNLGSLSSVGKSVRNDLVSETARRAKDQELQWSVIFQGKYQPQGFQQREAYLNELGLETMVLTKDESEYLRELRASLGTTPDPWESEEYA